MDIVDLSNSVPSLSISDFRVLGVLGLVHKGCFDYKIFVMDVGEANSRGISTLKDLQAKEQFRLSSAVRSFYNQECPLETPDSKVLWGGQIRDESVAMELITEHRQWYDVHTERTSSDDSLQFDFTSKL